LIECGRLLALELRKSRVSERDLQACRPKRDDLAGNDITGAHGASIVTSFLLCRDSFVNRPVVDCRKSHSPRAGC
jgi:hypothetical protein